MEEIIPRKHVDRKLLVRLSIFLGIAVAMVGIVGSDVVHGDLSWQFAGFGFLSGGVIGYILGRILTVRWHETKRKAFMEMDITGFIAIGVYIALRLSEDYVLGEWFTGAALSTLSLAVLAGALFGRFLGLRVSIAKLIEENA